MKNICRDILFFKSYKTFKRALLVLFVVSIAFFTQPIKVFADTGAMFSVTVNKNKYQADANKPYFYLKMPPKASTTLSFNIINQSNKLSNYTVTANRAFTNSNILIDYSPVSETNSAKLKSYFDFNNLVSPRKIAVQVNATQ